MKLSHKRKVQRKFTSSEFLRPTVTVVKSPNAGGITCCVGLETAAALILTAGGFLYTRRQYQISRKAAEANQCKMRAPLTGRLCNGAIIHTETILIDGKSFLQRICEEGHENLKLIKNGYRRIGKTTK